MSRFYNASNTATPSGFDLVENREYAVFVGDLSLDEVHQFIQESGLSQFLSWTPGNKFARCKITNYIGTIKFAGEEYDVKSSKFLNHLNGKEQLNAISDEIERITPSVTTTVGSPSLAALNLDWTSPSTSDLVQFNYLYQVFFPPAQTEGVLRLLAAVIARPHFEYSTFTEKDYIWKANQPTSGLILSLAKAKGPTVELTSGFPALRTALARHWPRPSGRFAVPIRLDQTKQILSYNTPENKFVKHFLRSTELLCLRLQSKFRPHSKNAYRCEKLLTATRQQIASPFFDDIGEMQFLPTTSSTLKFRHGYKEIFEHYIKCRYNVNPRLLETIDTLSIDLKDIATIYEIWCFYFVANAILGADIFSAESRASIQDGEILYETVLSNSLYEVAYNRSYLRHRSESYSLKYRPDISVKEISTGEVVAFDAKYKVQFQLDGNGEVIQKKNKNSDLDKMHAYVDAITKCKAAMVLYPGDVFSFFENCSPPQRHSNPNSPLALNGVGVIPLQPCSGNMFFKNFIEKFFLVSIS